MNPIQRLIRPLNNALQVFFARDLTLRRGEAGVEIVLAERDSGGRPVVKPSRAELQQRKERSELELMQQQLAAVLDEMPETRSTLRHLVFVEHALSRKGWRALHKLPLDVLQRALDQLEGLVQNWSPEGLANLRSKMAVAIIDREHMDPDAEADNYRTSMPMDLAPPPVRAETAMVDACSVSEEDGDALAAAYAALGAAASAPDPSPAELAARALAQVQASAQATVQNSFADHEPLEYHAELGSPSARSQPRENLAGKGKLGPIKLRELQG
jgi:hypothetical protein